jgi:hypothetical protein
MHHRQRRRVVKQHNLDAVANRLIKNCLIDNSDPASAAIDIQGATETITITDNNFAEPRGPAQRVAVRIGTQTRDIALKNNSSKGCAKETDEGNR